MPLSRFCLFQYTLNPKKVNGQNYFGRIMLNIKSNKVYATKKCNVCIGWFKSKKYFLVSRVAVLLVFLLSETKKLVLNKYYSVEKLC